MPEQMWEDRAETSALEAAKAETRRRRELASEATAIATPGQAEEDPIKSREWEVEKSKRSRR